MAPQRRPTKGPGHAQVCAGRPGPRPGEVSDYYVDDESLDWKELLSGNLEHQLPGWPNSTHLLDAGMNPLL